MENGERLDSWAKKHVKLCGMSTGVFPLVNDMVRLLFWKDNSCGNVEDGLPLEDIKGREVKSP